LVAVLNQRYELVQFLYHLVLLGTRSRPKYVLGYHHHPPNHRVCQESGSLRCGNFALVSDGRGAGRYDLSRQAASTQGRLYNCGRLAS